MYKILTPANRQVSANRSGHGFLRIRRTHESAHHLPRILRTLHNGNQRWSLGHEFHELVVIRLALVLGVVARCRGHVYRSQFRGDQTQLLALEARDDLSNEAACDAVGLHHEKGSIHDGETYQP